MILKKHLPLKAKYFAILGLITLPTISLANVQAEHAKQHHKSMSHPKIHGLGALNYSFDDTGINKVHDARQYGDWRFNEFKIGLSGEVKELNYNIEYAWFKGMLVKMVSTNSSGTYGEFREAYVSHKFSNDVIGKVGNTRVPFGNEDSFSFWHNLPFYAGMGENYQTGLKMIYVDSPWNVQVQLAKNSLVSPNNAETYYPKLTTGYYNVSNPIINSNSSINFPSGWYAQNNEDGVQLAARVVHTHHFNEHNKVEVGLSGRMGQIYNGISTARGSQWAGALHANAYLDRWIVQVQYLPYGFSPKYKGGVDTGTGAPVVLDTIQLGKDGVLYTIPKKANIFAAGLGYKIPVSWGKIEEVTVYDDYSILSGKTTKNNTKLNIVGFKFNAGPLFITAEAITGKNMVGIGQDSLPNGVPAIYNIGGNGYVNYGNTTLSNFVGSNYDDNTSHWKTKFNINIAAKF